MLQPDASPGLTRMDYPNARPLIRSGDLLATSHGSWRTWQGIRTNLVRIFTRSTYSHVGTAWVVGGRVFVLEAVKPKIRIFPLSNWGHFYWVDLDASWRADTEEFALARVGYDYSDLDAIKGFLDCLEPGKVSQCAAFVIEVLKHDGCNLGQRATPDAVVQAALDLQGSELVSVRSVV